MSGRTALEIAEKLNGQHALGYIGEAYNMLRQQHAEIERLLKQNSAYRTLNSAQAEQLAFHRTRADDYKEAIATLASECAANERLTLERDAAIAAEREAIESSIMAIPNPHDGLTRGSVIRAIRARAKP